jgi:hypothetical protein
MWQFEETVTAELLNWGLFLPHFLNESMRQELFVNWTLKALHSKPYKHKNYEKTVVVQNKLNLLLKNHFYNMWKLQLIQLKTV